MQYEDDLALHAMIRYKVPQAVPVAGRISLRDLATKCAVDEALLARFVRHAMTMHVFQEPEKDHVAHTADSKALISAEGAASMVGTVLEDLRPASLKVLDAVEKWPSVTEPTEAGFQLAYKTDESFYDWITRQPDRIERFSNHLQYLARDDKNATAQVAEAYDWSGVAAHGTMVDIGGGNGQYAIGVAEKHPGISCIIQDKPGVSAKDSVPSEVSARVTFQDYDFFTPQPVKDADFYFMRHVFHNWSDAYCIKILQNLIPALKAGARVLICDYFIPETSIVEEVFARRMDMLMLSLFNARERTLEDVKALFGKADSRFEFLKIYGTEIHQGTDTVVEFAWDSAA